MHMSLCDPALGTVDPKNEQQNAVLNFGTLLGSQYYGCVKASVPVLPYFYTVGNHLDFNGTILE